MLQTMIVALIIACAVAYSIWRTCDTIRNAGNPCHGCKLANACKKKGNGGCRSEKQPL